MSRVHHRRDGYWKYYHLAHSKKLDGLTRDIVFLVERSRPPAERWGKRTGVSKCRGRRPVHSWGKLVCVCLLMVVLSLTVRDAENLVPRLNLPPPWAGEPCPDHSTIHRAYQNIPASYLDSILGRAALLCVAESGWRTERGMLAADSTGVETDRYESAMKPSRGKKAGFEKTRTLTYLKYHVVVVLDYLIILKAVVTASRCADSPTLRAMLGSFTAMPGAVFNADRGFDAESNFERVYELGMRPNIKQRQELKGKRGRGRPRPHFRSRARRDFSPERYRFRAMVEAIFGAEEAHAHSLHTRFRKKENQEKWGIILATGWNLKVLNRLRCAKSLGIEVKPTTMN